MHGFVVFMLKKKQFKMGCDLQVDVNGEETFFVDKEILSSFSCKLSKLFNNPSANSSAKNLKVIFRDFPGGPEGFELFSRFCYKNGDLQVTPSNTPLLHCIAHFMEMSETCTLPPSPCLINLTRKSLEMIQFWTWSDTVGSLKQCQELSAISGSSAVSDKILDSLFARISAISDASPSDSPESSALRFSCDTRSTVSMKTANSRSWWFEDLVSLDPRMIEKVIKVMLSRKVEHGTISRFLFYYLNSRISNATLYEKKKAIEVTIELLNCLDINSVSCKRLFGILRVSSSLKISKACRSKLEAMIGAQIDQATSDDLLIPSSTAIDSIYDVNLILRFLKSFLDITGKEVVARLKRVGRLMDLYLAEVAPDSCLKPAKFVALIASLPDAARDCHDAIYQAIDMYLEVHSQLSDEEKTKICCCLNYEKLSSECCKHLAKNAKFPARITVQALVSQHSKLKSLLQDTNNIKSVQKSPLKGKHREDEDGEQIILYAKKLDLSIENEKLKAHLQGMQWRVMELEKVCKKMQTQMTNIMKSRKCPAASGSRSLPRLCS